MPFVQRQISVSFFAMEPMPAFEGQSSFPSGAYPIDDVLASIRSRDPAANDYRIREDLFGGETMCLLHDEGPQPIFGCYYRDNLAKALTELDGQVSELILRKGEALVDASYATFFPDDVVGLVRTSTKAPGFAKFGQWLAVQTGVSGGLVSLPDPDTLAQLDREPTRLRQLVLGAPKANVEAISSASPRIARVLRAASGLHGAIEGAGLRLYARDRHRQAELAGFIRETLVDLLMALPDLEEAKVWVVGQKRPINLKRALITYQTTVLLDGTKRVGLREATETLLDAYQKEHTSIVRSLEVVRSGRNDGSAATG